LTVHLHIFFNMPIVKGNKRKAATQEEIVAGQVDELVRVVTESEANNLPADVVKMIKEIMPYSLGQPKDKRQRFQEEAVDAMDRVIQGIEDTFRSQIAAANEKLRLAKEAAAPSEAAVPRSELQLQNDSNRFAGETEGLAQTALTFRAARTAVEDAKKAQELGDQEYKLATKQKTKLQGLIDSIAPLEKGEVSADDLTTDSQVLVSQLRNLGNVCDEAMLLVLGSAFVKPVDQRGDFDVMAIAQLYKTLNKLVEPQDAIINKEETGKKQRGDAVRNAELALEEAIKAQKVGAETFEAAWNAKKASEAALANAKTAVKELVVHTRAADKELYEAEANSDVFKEYGRAAFESLKERLTPEPVPEPAVEVATQEQVEPEAADDAVQDMQTEPPVTLPEAITA